MNSYKIFNKGIPFMENVSLSLETVAEACTSDKEAFLERVRVINDRLNDKLIKEVDLPFQYNGGVVVLELGDDLVNRLAYDPINLLLNYATIFNIDTDLDLYKSIEDLMQAIDNKLNVFKKVRLASNLEKEYPMLFELYDSLSKIQKDMKDANRKLTIIKNIDPEEAKKYEVAYKANFAMLKKYGFDRKTVNITDFVAQIYKQYKYLMSKQGIEKSFSIITSEYINLDDYEDLIDEFKLGLLFAGFHITELNRSVDNKIECLSYLTEYFKEEENNINNPTVVNIPIYYNGEQIDMDVTIKDLYKMYKEFLVNNPEVKLVNKTREDFKGYTLKDVEEYLRQYESELSLSWDILGGSTDTLYGDAKDNIRARNINGLTEEEKKEKLTHDMKVLEEKEAFFEDHKPYLLLKGKDSFNGYVGYVYTNALVVLERFYSNRKHTKIAEEAIYVMNVNQFIELSLLSKSSIIEDSLCDRITHHSGWQKKVEEQFKKEITNETIEDVQIFENQLRLMK